MRASGKNPTNEFIEAKTREVDVDESGGISFDEFVTYITEFVMSEVAENLMASFKLFDADGSGFITMQQFREVQQGTLR
jgi:Ca2+-binding EF-hand superfamily protein